MTHFLDLVPKLPPLFLDYRHTSPEFWLAGGHATRTNYSAADVVECSGSESVGCNAGDVGWSMHLKTLWANWITSHGHYLVPISKCGVEREHLFFFGVDGVNGSRGHHGFDPRLVERLGAWAELDEIYQDGLGEDVEEGGELVGGGAKALDGWVSSY